MGDLPRSVLLDQLLDEGVLANEACGGLDGLFNAVYVDSGSQSIVPKKV